jgi:ubiquinone/menaquinone biosynthesis C-methylase UbiE
VAAAKARAAQLGLSERCSFATAKAESTGLPDAHFDVVLAGQCWPWFDGPAAAKEARRVLRRGGMLVVCQFCYLPKRSEAARDTEALVRAARSKPRSADGR